MTNKIIILEDRSILEISGPDRGKFLQGLITNDINKATEKNLIFSVMLNAQGRFLYDFFIFESAEKLFLDCLASRRDEILQKLSFYKLRAQVQIKKNDELLVAQSFDNIGFADPRHKNLGQRIYLEKSQLQNFTLEKSALYHFNRIINKIPESENDLTYEKSFILEFGFDDLNAIDYQKGCYVGQELTARTHYRGEIRKKIFHIKIEGFLEVTAEWKITNLKEHEISCEGKSLGLVLSSVFHEGKLHALALIKIPQDQNFDDLKENLELEGKKIVID